ncbi:MAG: hypothetical protein IKH84_02090 [Ottowia sp.]|nr:hypothetical protein [Ottowia sp.]
MTAALTMDEAMMPFASAARQAGIPLPELMATVAKDAGVLRLLVSLTGNAGRQEAAIDAGLQTSLDPVVRDGLLAMREMGMNALKNGTADMTLDEINAEISASRRERRQATAQ